MRASLRQRFVVCLLALAAALTVANCRAGTECCCVYTYTTDDSPTIDGDISWCYGQPVNGVVEVCEGSWTCFGVSVVDTDHVSVDCDEDCCEDCDWQDDTGGYGSANWTASDGTPGSATNTTFFGWTAPMLGEGECEKTVTITATARDGATSCPGPGDCLEGNCKDGNGGSKSITVRVVKCSCEELEAEVTAGSFDPDPVCVGEETTLQPTISPPEDACICDEGAEYQYSWQFTAYKWIVSSGTWVETPATVNVTGGDTANPTVTFEFPSCGDWFVIARGTVSWLNENCYGRCSAEGSDYAEITVVGVDRVIVSGSITIDEPDGNSGPVGTCTEDPISLEARPCPEFATFPEGCPKWKLLAPVPAGSSHTANENLGSGTTISFTPDVPGSFKIEARCGDSADTITIVRVKLRLKQVSFSGSKYHTITKDGNPGHVGTFAAPHWQDNSSPLDGDADDAGDKKFPICFTRNSKMKVSATWEVEPASPGIPIVVRGDGSGNLDIPETSVSISGASASISNVECTNAFVNQVEVIEPLTIAWEYSPNDGEGWCEGGTSSNAAYITLGDPLTTVYHTLVHLGCTNAKGETAVAGTTAKIWTEFTDRIVRRVSDNHQLTYYAEYTCSNVTTAKLLELGDGQCGAWAKFFIDMRKVQGIDDVDEYVIFQPTSDDGFIVKNWTFTAGGGSSGAAGYPYLNVPDTPWIGVASYNWRFSDVSDAAGIPGQGNGNPASLFNNHQVVISGEYYDPSYGIKHASLLDIDNNAIDGFYVGPGLYPVDEPTVGLDLNGDGDSTDLGVSTTVLLFRKNPAGLDLTEVRINY